VSFVIAFLVTVLSAWVLAGFTADALMHKGRLVWLAVPAAIVGSLLLSCLVVFAAFQLGLATSEPFNPIFGSWVVTSWAGVLSVPVSLTIAIRIVVWEREDQEGRSDG
jgi:hypothetical protein